MEQQVCKWCREPIVPGTEAPWRHASGLYSCRYRPERWAAPADLRWENVYASIEPVDPDIWPTGTDILVFRIGVVYESVRTSSSQHVHKRELESTYGDLYALTLYDMVDYIDAYLDRI